MGFKPRKALVNIFVYFSYADMQVLILFFSILFLFKKIAHLATLCLIVSAWPTLRVANVHHSQVSAYSDKRQ